MERYEIIHEPLTDAFPRLDAGEDRSRWQLSPEQVARFHEQGFLIDLPLLDHSHVDELRARLQRIGDEIEIHAERLYEIESAWRERPNEVVFHFLGAWLVDRWFHDLVFHPGVTVPLAQLLGEERLRFWHDQVFWKPPHHPGVVPWHQDYSYWTRTAPAQHVSMFIALDDMSPANGCLQYVPGSQRWGLLPPVAFGGGMEQVREHLTPEMEVAFDPVPVELAVGRVSIHHSHILHGSHANPTDLPRRGVVLNYMGPDVRVADGSAPLLSGTPLLKEGETVSGDFFPLVL